MRHSLSGWLIAASLTVLPCAHGLAQQTSPPQYQPAASTKETLTRGLVRIELLVDSAVLGGAELEVAELTLPASSGQPAPHHRHGSVELLYLLSGELDHVVNGRAHRLTPGMVGIVRPPDSVAHRVVSAEPVRALVIWTPAGEIGRLRPGFQRSPAREDPDVLVRLRGEWTDAYQRGAAADMADLYTNDAVRMSYDTPQQVGRDAVLAAYGSSFEQRTFDPTITLTATEAVRTGDTTVERGTYREVLRSRKGAQVLLEEGKYVTLAERGADGRWRYRWSIFNRDAPALPLRN